MESNVIKQVLARMRPGTVFPVNQFFTDTVQRNTVEKELSRLVEQGVLQRFRRGIYYKPVQSSFFGKVLPNPTEIAQAIATLNYAKIIPNGAMALHMLGLTTQMPLKLTYLNDKLHKTEMIGNTPVVFKRISSKKLSAAGKKAGLVLSALSYLGKEEAKSKQIQKKLLQQLTSQDKQDLLKAVQAYPLWLQEIVEALTV